MIKVVPMCPDFNPDGNSWTFGEVVRVFKGEDDLIVEIPEGSRTNFASLPPPLRIVYRTWGRYTVPTGIHDVQYRQMQDKFTKKEVDRLFLETMKFFKVDWFTRNLFYVGVRVNIARAWNWNR